MGIQKFAAGDVYDKVNTCLFEGSQAEAVLSMYVTAMPSSGTNTRPLTPFWSPFPQFPTTCVWKRLLWYSACDLTWQDISADDGQGDKDTMQVIVSDYAYRFCWTGQALLDTRKYTVGKAWYYTDSMYGA